MIQELGEACTQPGHNRLQELASDFSPTTRAPETRSLTDQLMDGYARGSGYAGAGFFGFSHRVFGILSGLGVYGFIRLPYRLV